MKKILSVVALIAISASLVACGGEKKEAAPAEAPAVSDERPAQAVGWEVLRERLRARLGDAAVIPP